MPESPEVEALAEELGARLTGRALASVDVVEFRTTKTRARPPESLVGGSLTGTARHGKLVDLSFGPARHLVVSLGRHGWARWAGADDEAGPHDETGPADDAPPALVVLEFDDGSILELTDAGEWVSLGCWVVDDPGEVPAVAKLGPDPADAGFSRADFDGAVAGRRKQVKAVLQDQESLAGIGNAYSDEILFAAKLSPVGHAAALTRGRSSTDSSRPRSASSQGRPPHSAACRSPELKAAKVASMRVHGRAGEACPVCGDTIRDFSFASTTAQYCPTDQTHGEVLPLKSS